MLFKNYKNWHFRRSSSNWGEVLGCEMVVNCGLDLLIQEFRPYSFSISQKCSPLLIS